MPADETGIHFNNTIKEDDSTSSFIDEFGYMGGGVGVGDFNNDGLKDLFFTGNQTSCRLYLNKGDGSFEDVTEKAGLTTHAWATGVSIVDINNDGFDDIYICVFGKNLLQRGKNLLFVNQHNGTFTESAEEYGLAATDYSTQAVFFDYDRDGDLDMYLTNYWLNGPNANTVFAKDLSGHSIANDRLFRNDGDPKGLGHPVFTDVSASAGIRDCGYGLGVVASDLNGDGWPDLYVADDFVSDDLLWLNNRNGSFTDRLSVSTRHTSYSSMGVDAADINNDGLPDLVTLDMLPETNRRKKLVFSFMNYERYQLERSYGYQPQFVRNTLQLNNGNTRASPDIGSGDLARGSASPATGSGDFATPPIPYFSEIGQMAGISATDWSWSVLLADFDNDGWKDIHITNGIGRDFINTDFLDFSNTIFASAKTKADQYRLVREKLASLDHINLRNYLYLNHHDYTFTDASAAAGIDQPSMSGGAAYVDLDNDGDLDLVVNNIDAEAFVFINNTVQKGQPSPSAHYLAVRLDGDSGNTRGFGAKVWVYSAGIRQLQEENPVRGYFSSVDTKLIFGLGTQTAVDSLVVEWPDGRRQRIGRTSADTLLVLAQRNATWPIQLASASLHPASAPLHPASASLHPAADAPAGFDETAVLFSDASGATGLHYRHHENVYNDFAFQVLLPQKYSQLGPFITTADVNKDGLSDFYIGGAFNYPGHLFIQQRDGSFKQQDLPGNTGQQEDMDCVFFDADGDGDPDLLISGGDRIFAEDAEEYIPRLYLNDGKGNFTLDRNAIPGAVKTSAGCVRIGDFNGDGQPDIFLGGRIAKQFPLSPRSYLLVNDHGRFKDVTAAVCPAISRAGMVTAAQWVDFDKDGRLDLVVTGEWMPIRFFRNTGPATGVRLTEVTASTGLGDMHGQWRSLALADVDGDGDFDLIAGNLGLNCEYAASPSTPMELFATDLDGNGSIDPIFCYYIPNEDGTRSSYPAASRKKLAEQIPFIKKKFLYTQDYTHARFSDIYTKRAGDSLLRLYCIETRSGWLENKGKGAFIFHPLPAEAQFAPVNAIICQDFDLDGNVDLLLAGNEYQAEVMRGRYDASYGCFLKGDGRGGFSYSSGAVNGLILQGDIKSMALLPAAKGGSLLLAAANNDSLRVLKFK
jgi:hypothetical protein